MLQQMTPKQINPINKDSKYYETHIRNRRLRGHRINNDKQIACEKGRGVKSKK